MFGRDGIRRREGAVERRRDTQPLAAPGCQLKSAKGNIKHVIYIQFDNTHFRRDNPNVPSDLEQMPHLLNFITRQRDAADERPHGADLAHRDRHPDVADGRLPGPDGPARVEQLPLLQADGHDPDRRLVRLLDGAAVRPGRATVPPAQTDMTPEMINENGKIAPAPWVPYHPRRL